jgi:hypothetical protein
VSTANIALTIVAIPTKTVKIKYMIFAFIASLPAFISAQAD